MCPKSQLDCNIKRSSVSLVYKYVVSTCRLCLLQPVAALHATVTWPHVNLLFINCTLVTVGD